MTVSLMFLAQVASQDLGGNLFQMLVPIMHFWYRFCLWAEDLHPQSCPWL